MGKIAENLIGRRFGRLVVIGVSDKITKNGKLILKCKCDCGNYKDTTGGQLQSSKTKSCGCLHRELGVARFKRLGITKDSGIANRNYIISKYIRGAKRRNIQYNLTTEEFVNICSMDCNYCGIKPSTISNPRNKFNGNFVYNGIDRVDNSKGYTKENCVACCKICNRSKSDMTKEDFDLYIQRLTIFQTERKKSETKY